MAANRIAHEGETVHVIVETTRALENPCRLTLHVTPEGAAAPARTSTETLEASPAKPRAGAPEGELRFVVPWTVKLQPADVKDARPVRASVAFEVIDARNVRVKPRVVVGVDPALVVVDDPAATLGVARVVLTSRPEMLAIMRHEFASPSGDHPFDPARPQAFLDRLFPAQRTLLLNYPLKEGKARLVALATLTPKDQDKLMGADFAGVKPGAMKANASFGVFRCAGPGKVELVLYTEHLLVNDFNKLTAGLMKKADKRSAPRPRRFCLATGKMDPASNYKTPFMRLFSPFDDGPEAERSVDAMADAATGVNSIHGTINTHGCWSLFRNYNWPRAHFATFEAVYRAWRADQKRPDAPEAFAQDFPFPDDAPAGESPKEKQARISRRAKWKNRRKAQEALVAATKGETQLTPYDMSLASWHKFMLFDRNWAYYFLFRDLLGLVPNRHLAFVNVMETHGFRCRGNMPDAGKPPAGEQNAFTDDAFLDKTKTKREGLPVWGKNVFGDGPFDYALTKRATVKGKVVFRAENLAAASHMDLYLYAEAEEPFTRP